MKRFLCTLLTAVMLLSVFSLPSFAAVDVDYSITNPYKTVAWGEWDGYKADLHCHTICSDGSNNFAEMVEAHYAKDYDILAITDHGTVNNSWTEKHVVPGLYKVLSTFKGDPSIEIEMLTNERYLQISNGSDRGGRGMLRVPYTIEQNPTSFNNTHVNTFFADYGDGVLGGTSSYEYPIKNVEALGGLSVINHPGEYTGAKEESDPELAYNDDYSYKIDKFANILNKYHSCLGIDINSKTDGRTKYDRKLWDILLQKIVPTGRSVFAFATSDAHQLDKIDSGYTVMMMPSNTVDNLKTCMKNGAFFALSSYIKNSKELAILEKETDLTLENEWRCDPEKPRPVVTSISVDDAEDKITLSVDNALSIHWIANGEVLCTGSSIDLDDYSDKIGSYVRAEAFGEGGILYTQAFTLDYDGAPEPQLNENFFDFGNILNFNLIFFLTVLKTFPPFAWFWKMLTGH